MSNSRTVYSQFGSYFTASVSGETSFEQVRTYSFSMSVGRESVEFANPFPVGSVIITQAEYEAAKATAFTALGLVSSSIQDALFLEMCDAYDAQEATRFAA